MSEPQQLFGALQIAEVLGTTRRWVTSHVGNGRSPAAEFTIPIGRQQMLLWSQRGLTQWMVYHASAHSLPVDLDRYVGYSDHRAVNRVGAFDTTWKLWWRNVWDGNTQWWYSTPEGWYFSDDDGRSWFTHGEMVRPTDYCYHCVNTYASVNGSIGAVLRSCHQLRQKIEGRAA